MPSAPAWLSGPARWQWTRLADALGPTGLLTAADSPALALALAHWALARKAAEELAAADSLAVKDEKNDRQMKHPAAQVFRDQSASFLAYARELGLTSSARLRLPAQEEPDDGGGLLD